MPLTRPELILRANEIKRFCEDLQRLVNKRETGIGRSLGITATTVFVLGTLAAAASYIYFSSKLPAPEAKDFDHINGQRQIAEGSFYAGIVLTALSCLLSCYRPPCALFACWPALKVANLNMNQLTLLNANLEILKIDNEQKTSAYTKPIDQIDTVSALIAALQTLEKKYRFYAQNENISNNTFENKETIKPLLADSENTPLLEEGFGSTNAPHLGGGVEMGALFNCFRF